MSFKFIIICFFLLFNKIYKILPHNLVCSTKWKVNMCGGVTVRYEHLIGAELFEYARKMRQSRVI